MDFSTISNKTNCTEVEDLTNGELSERYYLLKKQYENLSRSHETTQQQLHEARRNHQTALDVQTHLTAELESHQEDEKRRKNDLNSRIASLQEEISTLREERSEAAERHVAELNRMQTAIRQLKEESELKVAPSSTECDRSEVDEMRTALSSTVDELATVKATLEQMRVEVASWQMRAESMNSEVEEIKEVAKMRKEEVQAANEREAVALADLAEARAMLHQCTNPQDLEPHAAKGNSLFAEVEDKRQEMAKNLIHMKQTNSKLRRELANKQAEVETLLHEKQTIWEQQIGAAAHYDKELIESYEERISQLEALAERQRRELARWFGKLYEPTANGWLSGVLDHLKTECEQLRVEVLSRGAAQLASAAQVRELRRKLASLSTTSLKQRDSPANQSNNSGGKTTNHGASDNGSGGKATNHTAADNGSGSKPTNGGGYVNIGSAKVVYSLSEDDKLALRKDRKSMSVRTVTADDVKKRVTFH